MKLAWLELVFMLVLCVVIILMFGFCFQMSLDNKRSEIRKLEERVLLREDALKKSEQMLEEDTVR